MLLACRLRTPFWSLRTPGTKLRRYEVTHHDHTPASLKLYNTHLPFVSHSKHLGHLISNDECTSHDLQWKRREFVGKIHSLRQELCNQSPSVYIKLIVIYFVHFYGHCLWDLSSEDAEGLWTLWNTTVRNVFELPYATHKFILEQIACTTHLKKKLYARFAKFRAKVRSSANPLVANLCSLQERETCGPPTGGIVLLWTLTHQGTMFILHQMSRIRSGESISSGTLSQYEQAMQR